MYSDVKPKRLFIAFIWGMTLACHRPPMSDGGEIDAIGREDVPRVVAAARGRVEGARTALKLGIGVDGVIKSVLVRAGDHVSAGDVLVIIDRDDLVQEEKASRAALDRAENRKLLLLRGARDEARRQASDQMEAATAVLNEARTRFSRLDGLRREGVISPAELDVAKRDLEEAAAKVESLRDTVRLLNADPLLEEIKTADAEVEEARARLKSAQARQRQRTIVAPEDGTVLKVYLHVGESVTSLNPRPVISITDTSQLHVRAELDEKDVQNVGINQYAEVFIDEVRVAEGYVTWLAPMMSAKTSIGGDPAERIDIDTREVLIKLGAHQPMVIDQRVTVHFFGRTKGPSD